MALLQYLHISHFLTEESDQGPGSCVTDQTPQIVRNDKGSQACSVVSYLARKTQGERSGNAAAHAQAVYGAEQADHESDWNRDFQGWFW